MRRKEYDRLKNQSSTSNSAIKEPISIIDELEKILDGKTYDIKIISLKNGEKVIILTLKEAKQDGIGHETL